MMRDMNPAVQTKPSRTHEDEKAEQEAIAAQIQASTPQVEGTPTADQPAEPKITLRPVDVPDGGYPLGISVVGSDELVFADANATVEVSPYVAEQTAYIANVEIAE